MAQITEDYVSFETAKLLKKKGFDADIDLWYDEKGGKFFKYHYDIKNDWRVQQNQQVYQCPTLQMAMKWLRKEHKLEIYPFHYKEYSRDKWGYDIKKEMPLSVIYKFQMPAIFDSYEQACDAAIQYCLENLI